MLLALHLNIDWTQMLDMKPACERCDTPLAPHAHGAFICSFEDTFCADCADELDEVCPKCRGELVDRPARRK
ncbi:hypothetical protein ASE78_06270 [Sphingomonas sp. Leaf25]|nr:hypothetical protein ASE78_06270 [Sphingomonas sp. Leaf25]